jgi:hypothetical protein
VQSFPSSGGMRYGPNFTRKRHDDRGGPSSDTASQESLRAPATRYGGNPKTVFKWRKRSSVADLPTGPREPKSSVLSGDHRRVPAPYPPAARRLSLRPAGDHIPSDAVVPASLLATTRRQPAPEVEGDKTATKNQFKSYAIGFFHVDIAEVRTKEGKLQVARPSSQLRRPLQFRPQPQDPQRPHAIPVHLQMLDFGPEKIQPGSTPSNAGTKHLEPAAFARNRHREERSGAAIQMAVGRPMTPDCFASLAMTIVVRPICNLR